MPADGSLLAGWVEDARRRSLEIYRDIDPERELGPRLGIVNPPLWEVGHVAWFQSFWVLRHARGGAPVREGEDALYDSMKIPHDTRWDLPLPSWQETIDYAREVCRRVVDRLGHEVSDEEAYFVTLSVFHEDMHDEAFTYTRQTHGWPAPPARPGDVERGGGPLSGDAEVPGGRYLLGAAPGAEPFVFDNEKWAHEVEVAPFAIAKAPVTQAELCAFVEDGGYSRRELWSEPGWAWRAGAGAEHPLYWRRAGDGWERRLFDRWVPLEPYRPAIHVNYFEAEAYCRFAGRRLPTEAEWELAAGGFDKRRFPWGDEPPGPALAHLGARALCTADVGAYPAGDSPFGCRQMLGNVWEWCADDFGPYPGFVADPYADYSAPWFGDHKVLRGGCHVTRDRLLRNTWRNFYQPARRDVFAGFRTCALERG